MEPDRSCDVCGLTAAGVDDIVRHLEHLALPLPALEQRRLRSHLFALLAGLDAVPAGVE
jgi:hypothetical protein